jgi:hypothetical protein
MPSSGSALPDMAVMTHGQIVRRQALLRAVNEELTRIDAQLADGDEPDGSVEILCECGRGECSSLIELTRAEYERIHGERTSFVILPSHANPGLERVTDRNERFATVEALVPAGEIALESGSRA